MRLTQANMAVIFYTLLFPKNRVFDHSTESRVDKKSIKTRLFWYYNILCG